MDVSSLSAAGALRQVPGLSLCNVAEGWPRLALRQGSEMRRLQISRAEFPGAFEAARALSHVVVAGDGAVAVTLLVIYVPSSSVRSSAVCRSVRKYQTEGPFIALDGSTYLSP